MQYYFNYQPGEVFACTADIGWITGHSYVVYGPLCNGATTVLFDSAATYPSAGKCINLIALWYSVCVVRSFISLAIVPARCWELITELSINHFYTTPSVIRKLMSNEKEVRSEHSLSSLRIIASGRSTILMFSIV